MPRNARASSAGRGSKQTRTIGEATRWRTLPPDDRRRTYFAAEHAEIVVAAGAEVTTVAPHSCVGAAPHGAAHDRRIDAIVEAEVLEIRRILRQRDRTTTELAAPEDLNARGTIAARARRIQTLIRWGNGSAVIARTAYFPRPSPRLPTLRKSNPLAVQTFAIARSCS